MEKMRMESVDMTARNIEKIAALFPNCVTEAKGEDGKMMRVVNFDLLRQMLSSDVSEEDEAYEFTWVGKRASIVEANKPIRKTLRPCIKESVIWNTTENLYIEGDNLEVLKLLQESYLGKIKMIYIDPPYNTGNDFIYRDDFSIGRKEYDEEIGAVDEDGNRMFRNNDSNGRFHSVWCSMMYPRLMLARNLLSDDGVIFISIDENEADSAKKICDEVFGRDNYRNQLLVRRRIKSLNVQFADNGLRSFNVGFEYVYVYSKTASFLFNPLRMKKQNAPSKGSWNVFWSNADRPTMRYDILGFTPTTGQWRWQKELADEAVANYREYETKYAASMTLEEYWKKTGEKKKFVRRIEGGYGKNGGVQYWVAPSDTSLRTSNWTDIEVSQIAKDYDLPFDNPKNVDLLKEIVKSVPGDDFIVLDFFSGSATTADAVLRLNAEDGGTRKFIMVQVPQEAEKGSQAEKAGYSNICEIGKERIRQAAEKISGAGNVDAGFRVFKLDESNMNDVYYSANDYTQDLLTLMESNVKSDRSDLDLLFGCLLEWGLPVSMPYSSETISGCVVHTYNDGDLIACFDENIPDSVIKDIAKRQPLRAVFRDSSFSGSPAKINVGEIFKMLAPDTRVKVI